MPSSSNGLFLLLLWYKLLLLACALRGRGFGFRGAQAHGLTFRCATCIRIRHCILRRAEEGLAFWRLTNRTYSDVLGRGRISRIQHADNDADEDDDDDGDDEGKDSDDDEDDDGPLRHG